MGQRNGRTKSLTTHLNGVSVREYRRKITKAESDTESYRTSIPQPIMALLNLEKGGTVVWTWDPATRKVTVTKGSDPGRR